MKTRFSPTHLARCGIVAAALFGVASGAPGQSSEPGPIPRKQPRRLQDGPGGPGQTPQRPPGPADREAGNLDFDLPLEFRTITGADNHINAPELGTPGQLFLRLAAAAYEDGAGSPAGPDRPSARVVSNEVAAQEDVPPNRRGASDFLWQWGQFLDHDIDETPAADPEEAFDILVPAGDPLFDPQGTGSATIGLNRSAWEAPAGVREQFNAITAYIDASNVYGSDDERAFALRALDGTGRLAVSASAHGDLLPFNTTGVDNIPPGPNFFLAGDVRANEQTGLTAMHTLFVREHNQWADLYRGSNPTAGDEEIYQFARMIVGAEMQAITYREFLPVLLGPNALPRYRGYREEVNPNIANEFATAAYRLGHSLLSSQVLRLDARGREAPEGHLSLAQAFFNPAHITDNGIDSILRGLAGQRCQELDHMLVDDVRNFLFGAPGSGGLDLASLNIQRGRDHGLGSYNQTRRALGLRPARSFRDIHPDRAVQRKLATAYVSVDQVDLWVGGLSEAHVRGAMVGETFHRILTDQFIRLRDGDRFYYEGYLPRELSRVVERQTLSTIIRRNTEIGRELQDNAFEAPRTPPPGAPRPGANTPGGRPNFGGGPPPRR